MINPDAELSRLRFYLQGRDWLPSEIDEIVDLASRDVNNVMLDIISEAVAEATDYAIEIGAEDFIEDMDIVEIGGSFHITTYSGKTDYSTPERKQLPGLLDNAEVSESGKRYKRIPISNKKETKVYRDIFSALRDRESILKEARDRLIENNLDMRSARAQQAATHFRNVLHQRLHERREAMRVAHRQITPGETEFRTVTEDNDPNTDWVIPAKEMDMTGFLLDMNSRIEGLIQEGVTYIIESYEREFA